MSREISPDDPRNFLSDDEFIQDRERIRQQADVMWGQVSDLATLAEAVQRRLSAEELARQDMDVFRVIVASQPQVMQQLFDRLGWLTAPLDQLIDPNVDTADIVRLMSALRIVEPGYVEHEFISLTNYQRIRYRATNEGYHVDVSARVYDTGREDAYPASPDVATALAELMALVQPAWRRRYQEILEQPS